MKLNELKHNHSLTDLLKILLFSILMLAPVGMVASRCLYVIANKNAYQSYYGETINQITYEDVNTISTPNKYRFVNDNTLNSTDTNGSKYFSFDSIKDFKFTNNNYDLISLNGNDYNYCILYFNNNYRTLGFIGNDTAITKYVRCEYVQYIDFENFYASDSIFLDYLKIPNYNKDSYLDNVYEYSISQLEQSNLFNWTKNTAIYSGVETMTTQLGITNQTIPILLVYWFLLTVIYVIIDIILKLFTYMTHALSSRKA